MSKEENILRCKIGCLREGLIPALVVYIGDPFVEIQRVDAERVLLSVGPYFSDAGRERLKEMGYRRNEEKGYECYEAYCVFADDDGLISELRILFEEVFGVAFRKYHSDGYANEANEKYQVAYPKINEQKSPIKRVEQAITDHYEGRCEYIIIFQGDFVVQFAAKYAVDEPSYIEVVCPIDFEGVSVLKHQGYKKDMCYEDLTIFKKVSYFNSPEKIFCEVKRIFEEVFRIDFSNCLVEVAYTKEAYSEELAEESSTPTFLPVEVDEVEEVDTPAEEPLVAKKPDEEPFTCMGCLLYLLGVAALLGGLWLLNGILWP